MFLHQWELTNINIDLARIVRNLLAVTIYFYLNQQKIIGNKKKNAKYKK
jgi:hypothetical protein